MDIFNLDITVEELNIDGSLLEGASIYVGETLCATMSSKLVLDTDQLLTCLNPTGSNSVYDPNAGNYKGTEGHFIRIIASKPGIMSICDLTALAGKHDHEAETE